MTDRNSNRELFIYFFKKQNRRNITLRSKMKNLQTVLTQRPASEDLRVPNYLLRRFFSRQKVFDTASERERERERERACARDRMNESVDFDGF
jgi:hypothetical protein